MAKKKYKKRQRSFTEQAKRQVQQEKLADEKARSGKRFDPTARALLLCDLVFLSITALLENNGVISSGISTVCTLIGLAALIAALWFQFGPKDRGFGKGPKL